MRHTMWIFSPSGLLMPGLVPTVNGKSVANPELTRDGQFELQVRARLRSHLDFFISENFKPLGLEYSAIEATPQMDYNFRFYTTRENLALAVANQVRAIDYVKYKEQSERKGSDGTPMYPDGKKFHDVLVRAWGLLTSLNPAGGWYGTYSADNPRGSKPRASHTGSTSRPVTASNSILAQHYGTEEYDDILAGWDEPIDWTPSREQEADALMDEFEDVPREQWDEFMTQREIDLVTEFYPEDRNEYIPSRRETRIREKAESKRAKKSKSGRKKFFQKA